MRQALSHCARLQESRNIFCTMGERTEPSRRKTSRAMRSLVTLKLTRLMTFDKIHIQLLRLNRLGARTLRTKTPNGSKDFRVTGGDAIKKEYDGRRGRTNIISHDPQTVLKRRKVPRLARTSLSRLSPRSRLKPVRFATISVIFGEVSPLHTLEQFQRCGHPPLWRDRENALRALTPTDGVR